MLDMNWARLLETRNRKDRRILRLLEERWQFWEHGGKLSFSAALCLFSSLQCHDPRDKIYGTLGLIDWGDAPLIEPDYSRSRYDLAVECLYLLHAQTHFALVSNQQQFAQVMRRMEIEVYVGEPPADQFERIFGMRRKGDGNCKMFAFREHRILKCYKPSIGVPMFGMPLSKVLNGSQTIVLSYNGRRKEITYPRGFGSTGAKGHHHLSGDPLDARESDWILKS
jgi:hypothetical protein